MHAGGVTAPSPDEASPEFGPRGYLPPRAARRARKIILREQMGLGWPLAAVAACVAVVVVGIAFLLRAGPPGPPFQAAGPLGAVPPSSAAVVAPGGDGAAGDPALVVRAGGRLRAFAAPGTDVAFCEDSRRLESADGTVWTLDGVLVGGQGTSLRPVAASVYEGTLYLDTTTSRPELPADPRGEVPAC